MPLSVAHDASAVATPVRETASATPELREPQFSVIENYDNLAPFLMTLVSASDVWLYVSSSGGVTAGRINAEHALFPYETVDRLHEAPGLSGPITLLHVQTDSNQTIWQPFDLDHETPGVVRSLRKDALGTSIRFDERNDALGLGFSYRWEASAKYGVVRHAELTNYSNETVRLSLLDGLRNILPTGIPRMLQRDFGCLTDAYKTSELDSSANVAIYSTSSAISDRSEPQESLRSSVVWSRGLPGATVSLDASCVRTFRKTGKIDANHDVRGRKGAFFQQTTVELAPGQTLSWVVVADVNHDHVTVQKLRKELLEHADPRAAVQQDLEQGKDELLRLLAASDALQAGATEVVTAHHAANVLFNGMRGGVLPDGYLIDTADFAKFVGERNREQAALRATWFQELPAQLHVEDLLQRADRTEDATLRRLAREYLPLTFGRRHGDPSRPWNRFSISIKRGDQRILGYEGNWRDIFQNWEALCFSYPLYLGNVVTKFLSAMTLDGFNPYRLSRAGIDWEVPEPENPFSHIGYWGDHQVVYLARLVEHHMRFFPGALSTQLEERIYSFADIPYRIRPYAELLRDPRRSIDFDYAHHELCEKRSARLGGDGRLVHNPDGTVRHASLAEKLLIILLSKCSNFIPDGGIWLNTQRPEWNDANNALVGHAASMVTLYQLERFQKAVLELLKAAPYETLTLDANLSQWLGGLREALEAEKASFVDQRQLSVDDEGRARKRLLDRTGLAFERYRTAPLDTKTLQLPVQEVISFLELAQQYYEETIRRARRDDGLYQSYQLLEFTPEAVLVHPLFEMLEGQVAAISVGESSPSETSELIERLEQGPMYRADQNSFLLYPRRTIAGYLERNRAPRDDVQSNPLLTRLLEERRTDLVVQDAFGDYRFHHDLSNARDLQEALKRLASDPKLAPLIQQHESAVLAIYERTFQHRNFTGRSGTMYAYEGIGSIYWHMVSKLILAIQERVIDLAQKSSAPTQDPELLRLARAYYRVRGGLCFNKTAEEYGAFPVDPYSHTPPFAGAQQPGMTGQVKEGVLIRWGELGVEVTEGRLGFFPRILLPSEFAEKPMNFRCLGLDGAWRDIQLKQGELGFTYCQVPVVYRLGRESKLFVQQGSSEKPSSELALDLETSRSIFERRGTITGLVREISPSELLLHD